MTRGWGVLAALAMLTLAPVNTESAVAAAGDGNFDAFNANTFNEAPGGNEVPYTSAAEVTFLTPTFDTSGFGLQAGESGPGGNYHGCIKPPPVFAGKTAWVRFNPGVAGTIAVLANTPGYDSILMLREANDVPWATTTFSDLAGNASTCADVTDGPGVEGLSGFPARADKAYYVQVGGKCPTDVASCSDLGAVPGGPTSIRLTFTPSDSDGDGVPDTTDQCPGQGTAGQVNAVGCPDRDHDQIADAQDSCPDLPGVAADPPFNGCPAGPTPPGGSPRVTIVSAGGDTLNTASTQVFLKLDWRQGTRQVLVDNAIGDPPKPVDFTQPLVPWTLPSTSKSESRQVNVRFLGPGIDDNRTDTITLDTAPPDLVKSTVLPPSGGRWAVGFKTTDGKGGSGVASVTLLDRKKKAVSKPARCRKSCATFLQSTPSREQPRFALLIDKAGNRDVVKLSPAQRGCRVMVLAYDPPTARMCFRPGKDRCEPGVTDTIWNFEQRDLVCTAAGRVIRRR